MSKYPQSRLRRSRAYSATPSVQPPPHTVDVFLDDLQSETGQLEDQGRVTC